MSEQKQALSSKGVAVVGVDTSEVIKRVMKKMHDRLEAQELARKIEQDRWQGEVKETRYVIETDLGDGRFRLESVEEVPQIGIVRAFGTRKGVRAEFRYEMAKAWQKARLVKSWDEARERAAKMQILYA
jgi:hypothetical protein